VELGYPAFDADNHYYEAIDAFTRHLDPKLGARCVEWATINGRQYQVVGGKVSRAVVNATFDPIAKAGAMHEYFRGNPNGRSPMEFLREREPIPAHYRGSEARLKVMDEQNLEAIWLFPTLGVLYEEIPKRSASHSPPSTGGFEKTGVSTTRTASSRLHTSRCGMSTGRSRSSSGRSTRVPASS
jgi:hypothetical protein